MKKILMALMLSVLAQSALAFDYSSYTVTWKDAKNVVHTDPITKKATDPRHMIALLQELYCNPVFPGNKNVDGEPEGSADKLNVPYTGQYYGRTVKGAPYEEGYTCVLVECKENSNTSIPTSYNVSFMEKCFKSIQLITDVVDNEDAYLFSINGKVDHFYIAAKGKARECTEPWWERLGATGNTGEFATIGLYDKLERGGKYALSHDCSNLTLFKHYFTMEQADTVPNMRNLTFTVPKNRMKFWDQTTHPGFKWTNTDNSSGYQRDNDGACWYHPEHYPHVSFYHANLSGSAIPADDYDFNNEQKRNFTVSLNWTSNLKDENTINWTGGETYELYLINEDGSETLITTYNDQVNHSYNVAQQQEAYKLRYKVVCYPTNDEGIKVGPAETNVLTVAIPGFNDEMALKCEYRSRFEEAELKNSYKNTIQLTFNGVARDAAITISRKNANDDNTNATVATVNIANDGSYTISYNSTIDVDNDLRFDNKPLTLAGNVKNGVTINDYFLASTENGGDLSGGYIYTVTDQVHNITAFVPVYSGKMNNTYNTAHCANDVITDDARTLAVTDKAFATVADYSVEKSNVEIYKNHALTVCGNDTVANDDDNSINTYTARLTAVSDFGCNTYGTNSVDLQAAPSVAIDFTEVSNYNYENCNKSNYGVTLRINPSLTANAPYVYYYRVWRVEETEGKDAKITLLNNLNELVDTAHVTPMWGTTYRNIKDFFPRGEMADQNAGIVYVHDIYTTERNSNSNTVTYIVRMYSTSEYDDQGLCAVAASDDEDLDIFNPECLVSENRTVVTFSNNIITAVDDINAQKTVSSVRYVNLLGATSDQPFSGVNIVVTTYTDGTQSTMKMCK